MTLLSGSADVPPFNIRRGLNSYLSREAVVALCAIAAIAAAPLVFNSASGIATLSLIGIYALHALGYDLVLGRSGVVSFGHAGFLAIGGYSTAMLATGAGWSILPTVVVGVVISVVASIVLGLASLRLSGLHFALATLAFAESLRIVINNLQSLTNGPNGISLPRSALELVPGLVLTTPLAIYSLIWVTLLIAVYLVRRLAHSWVGDGFTAIRDNEELAAAVGIHALPFRIAAFALGGAMASVAGALYAVYVGIVTPPLAGVHFTALPLLMVMLGGRATLAGPIVGAAIFVLLPGLFGLEGSANEALFGLLLLGIVLGAPRGLVPGVQQLVHRVKTPKEARP